MRVLAGRVDLQPAAGSERGLLQLGVIERRTRRLLGDGLVVGALGSFAVQPRAGGILAPAECGFSVGQAGLGRQRVAHRIGPGGVRRDASHQ